MKFILSRRTGKVHRSRLSQRLELLALLTGPVRPLFRGDFRPGRPFAVPRLTRQAITASVCYDLDRRPGDDHDVGECEMTDVEGAGACPLDQRGCEARD